MATTDQETLQTFDLNLGHFQRVKPTLSLTTKTTLKPSPRPDTYTVYETDFNLRSTFPKVITTGEIPYFMHGISDDTGEPYTIAIFAFHMAPRGVNWRIREVHIEAAFEFIKEDPNEYASHPEIIAYSPKYTSFYNLSEHKESDSSEWSAVPSVTTPGWSISVPGWKRQILAHDIPVKDYVRVNGTRPEPYTVEWDVLENKTTRSGVPPFFRTAVHLRRRPEDAHRPFTCTMKLRAKINKRRKLGWESRWKAMGGTPPEKPIIFDPRRRDNPGKLDQHRHKISGFRIEDWSAVAPYWVAEDVRMEMKRKM
ncbi:hypothetical protein VTJ04DRAFT_4499 [Mycothermus thermophilus]|uniref:uncharacterized protein n=1 Tax=Humicola insolens TaxID=85995 RepID=UPI0037439939